MSKVNATRTASLICFAFFILFTSCSIEKRKYLSGYHVDWKKVQSGTSPASVVNTAQESESISSDGVQPDVIAVERGFEKNNALPAPETNLVASASEEVMLTSENIKNIHFTKSVSDTLKKKEIVVFRRTEKDTNNTKSDHPDTREMNHNATIGFVLSLIGFVFPLLGLLCCIPAIVYSIIGLRQINKDPVKWKGKKLAVLGLIFGILGFLLLLIVIWAFLPLLGINPYI